MTPRKKITFFLPDLAHGGGERVMLSVAEGVIRAGQEADILTLSGSRDSSRIPQGVQEVRLSASHLRGAIFGIARYLKEERPEALIATNEHGHLAILLAAAISRTKTRIILRVGIPLSQQFHRHRSFRAKVLMPILVQFLYPRANQIIAVSEGVAEDLSQFLRLSRERILVIPHPEPIDSIRVAGKMTPTHQWLREKTVPVIVALGRLREQKGFDMLLHSCSKVFDHTPARLIIFGEGSEREKLLLLAQELGIEERVSLPGFPANPYGDLSRADAFVLSSRWEGLPSALIDALVLGIPSIATDCVAGPREILHPEAAGPVTSLTEASFGLLAPEGDIDALAQGIERLITDPALSARYAEASDTRAQDFNAEKIMPRYLHALGISDTL